MKNSTVKYDMIKNTAEFSTSSELYLDNTSVPSISGSVSAIPSMVNCDNLQTKRKHSAVESTAVAIDSFSERIGEVNQSEESSRRSSRESLSLLNKKELRILRMQIAMISDVDGDRPIHVAVVQENLKLVQKLCAIMLKAAISIDLTNYLRQTPLHLAVMLGNIEMIKLLLKCGSSLTMKDRNGNSVIHLAVKTEAKKDVLCLILSHPQANSILNSMDHEGYTALHYAVLKSNKTAISCLHRCGADMNATDGKSGRTALMHAIMGQNAEIVKHMLECGTSVDIADYSGRSAFELAMQMSDKDTVKLLENKLFSEEVAKSTQVHQQSTDIVKADRSITHIEDSESTTYHRTKKFKSI